MLNLNDERLSFFIHIQCNMKRSQFVCSLYLYPAPYICFVFSLKWGFAVKYPGQSSRGLQHTAPTQEENELRKQERKRCKRAEVQKGPLSLSLGSDFCAKRVIPSYVLNCSRIRLVKTKDGVKIFVQLKTKGWSRWFWYLVFLGWQQTK